MVQSIWKCWTFSLSICLLIPESASISAVLSGILSLNLCFLAQDPSGISSLNLHSEIWKNLISALPLSLNLYLEDRCGRSLLICRFCTSWPVYSLFHTALFSMFSNQNDPPTVLGCRHHESVFHLGPRKRAWVMVAGACIGADEIAAP
jgi:hypothetical protein